MLVRRYYLRLKLHSLRNQPLQFQWIALQNLGAILLESQEQFDVPNDAALQRFVESSPKFAVGQRLQYVWIDQDNPWMIKSSDQILAGNKIHTRFPTDGSIHLGEHGRRNLHELNATHIQRGQQSGDITHHAPT